MPYFRDMVLDNYASDKSGVQAQYGTISSGDCNCDYGDYVAKSPEWSHVLIVVSLPDADADLKHDYNEIYVSAHTTNHNQYQLAMIYPSYTAVTLVRIVRYKTRTRARA